MKTPPMTKKQRDEYLAKIKADKATPKEKPNVTSEILEAHKGNVINKELIRENAGNVEKVLELAKDVNTTKRYIKALEDAKMEVRPDIYRVGNEVEERGDGNRNHYIKVAEDGRLSKFYYVEKKPLLGWWTKKGKWIIFYSVGAVIVAYGSESAWTAFIAFATFGGFLAILYGIYRFFKWLENNKKFQRSHYESSKRFVAIVKANGMMVPPPDTKENYRQAALYAEEYERMYPQEFEPYRMWLSPQELNFWKANARAAGRKPVE